MQDSSKRRLITIVLTIAGLGSWRATLHGWQDTIDDVWGTVSGDLFGWSVIAACAAVVVWLNFNWFRWLVGFPKQPPEPPPPPPRWATTKDLGDELHDWLRVAGYTLTQLADPALDFAFTAVEPITARGVTVLKATTEQGVRIQGLVKPDGHHLPIVSAMNAGQLSAMNEDLSLELARLGISFDAQNILDPGIALMVAMVPSEQLTGVQFVNLVKQIERAELVTAVVVTRHVRLASPGQIAPAATVEPTVTPLLASPAGEGH